MSNYYNLFYDDGLYRMYYLGREFGRPGIVVCYAQSRDGIHFEKPELGICEYKGSKANNIIWNSAVHSVGSGAENVSIDNFMVFRDDNPNCEKDKRYKAIARWDSFEQLCGKQKRLERMEKSRRYGLTTTDCVFMCSRDGVNFRRYDEAFMRPNPEDGCNWVYGDCYPGRGMILTPSIQTGADDELSFYATDNHWIGKPAELIRYTLRRDGFVSMHAGAKERKVVTKEFTDTGEKLLANLEISAWGYAFFALVDREGNRFEICEYFGNSTDKEIVLPGDTVKAHSGKLVKLEVRLRDADLYAIRFGSN